MALTTADRGRTTGRSAVSGNQSFVTHLVSQPPPSALYRATRFDAIDLALGELAFRRIQRALRFEHIEEVDQTSGIKLVGHLHRASIGGHRIASKRDSGSVLWRNSPENFPRPRSAVRTVFSYSVRACSCWALRTAILARILPASKIGQKILGPIDQKRLGAEIKSLALILWKPKAPVNENLGYRSAVAAPTCAVVEATCRSARRISGRRLRSSAGIPTCASGGNAGIGDFVAEFRP